MSIEGDEPDREFQGEQVRISTGNSVVRSNTWVHVDTPWGQT
jgi:hypothetical protein